MKASCEAISPKPGRTQGKQTRDLQLQYQAKSVVNMNLKAARKGANFFSVIPTYPVQFAAWLRRSIQILGIYLRIINGNGKNEP